MRSVSDQADVLVVGAAVVRHGRVLATRRTNPPEAAGMWEFPGGKVEPGEEPGGRGGPRDPRGARLRGRA